MSGYYTGAKLRALLVLDERAWAKVVRAALIASEGRVAVTAKALGVTPRTLRGWIAASPQLVRGIEMRGRGWLLGRKRAG